MHINVKYMSIQKIYLLYHCDYVNLPYITMRSQKKKLLGWKVLFLPVFLLHLMYFAT